MPQTVCFPSGVTPLLRHVSGCLLLIWNDSIGSNMTQSVLLLSGMTLFCSNIGWFGMPVFAQTCLKLLAFDLECQYLHRHVSSCLLLIWNVSVGSDMSGYLLLILNNSVCSDMSQVICFWSGMPMIAQTCLRLFAFDLVCQCLLRHVSSCLLLICNDTAQTCLWLFGFCLEWH